MDITEVSILHHVAIMIMGIWLLSAYNLCHPLVYFTALMYLYLLRRKMQFEERKKSYQRKVILFDTFALWIHDV
ncbi:hypothetical protein Lalb_Chr01g0016141 [Lupinus albus]|uniref:Uncharacterized protein n=1 Tax=Lupinus albus TaxID=3870 RepID=A0A6A4R3T1_LUPAL|nr:hypothetical protein Lalb_Chr01g0016141 [Lupinus albus]